MNSDKEGQVIENNICELWISLGSLGKAALYKDHYMLCFVGGIPCEACNLVLDSRFRSHDARDKIHKTLTFFESRNLPMTWWVGPSSRPAHLGVLLKEQGMTHELDDHAMAMDLKGLNGYGVMPSGLVIREAIDRKTLEKWLYPFEVAFDLPDLAGRFFFDLYLRERIRKNSIFKHYVGLINGEPVACASLLLGKDAAGIYNVGTIPPACSHGIGTAMTYRALQEAKARGYGIGVLQACERAVPLYRRIGFETRFRLSMYVLDNEIS